MTEPDIAHAVKEIWGARVVYVRLAKVIKFDQIGKEKQSGLIDKT